MLLVLFCFYSAPGIFVAKTICALGSLQRCSSYKNVGIGLLFMETAEKEATKNSEKEEQPRWKATDPIPSSKPTISYHAQHEHKERNFTTEQLLQYYFHPQQIVLDNEFPPKPWKFVHQTLETTSKGPRLIQVFVARDSTPWTITSKLSSTRKGYIAKYWNYDGK